MKNTKTCPKCESKYVIRIPANPRYLEGNVIREGFMGMSAIPITTYLCGKCGFTEEWVDKRSDIDRLLSKDEPI